MCRRRGRGRANSVCLAMRPPFSSTGAPEHLLWLYRSQIYLVPGKDVGLLRGGQWVSRDPQGERQHQLLDAIRNGARSILLGRLITLAVVIFEKCIKMSYEKIGEEFEINN